MAEQVEVPQEPQTPAPNAPQPLNEKQKEMLARQSLSKKKRRSTQRLVVTDATVLPVNSKKTVSKKPNTITPQTITGGNGETRIVARGNTGQFTKLSTIPMSSGDMVRGFREFLETIDEKDPNKKKKMDVIYERWYEFATDDNRDVRMATIKALDSLSTRVFGKANTSDEQMAAERENAGVKILVITQQPLPTPPAPKQLVEKTAPAFIDAEIISTNPQ